MKEDISYRVDADTKPFRSKMDGVKKTARDAGSAVVGSFKTMGLAISAAFAVQGARRLAAWGDEISTLADTIGVGTEFLQRWQAANLKAGIGMDKSGISLQRFSRQVGDAQRGQGELAKTLADLGINLRDNQGRLKSVEQVLFEYTDAIREAKTEQQGLALATRAFGDEGAALASNLKKGSDALREGMESAVVATDAEIRSLAQMNAELEDAGQIGKVFGSKLVAGLAPGLLFIPRMLRAAIAGEDYSDTLLAGANWMPDEANLRRLESILKSQNEAAQNRLDELKKQEEEITAEKEKQVKHQDKIVAAANAQAQINAKLLGQDVERLLALKERAKRLAGEISTRSNDRFGMTVAEVANPQNSFADRFGLSGRGNKNVADARRIQELEQFASFARLNEGPDPKAEALERRKNRINRTGEFAPGAGPMDLNAAAQAITGGFGNPFMLGQQATTESDRIREKMESLDSEERGKPSAEMQQKLEEVLIAIEKQTELLLQYGIPIRAN